MSSLLQKITKNKVVYYALVIIIFMALIDFFVSGKDIAQEKYGINIWAFFYIFLISEVFFNFGIYLVLKGSGLFRIKIRDVLRFKFEGITSKHPLVYYGFLINRFAAIAPWAYVLIVGAKKLPIYITTLVIIEISIVIYIGVIVSSRIEAKSWKRITQ